MIKFGEIVRFFGTFISMLLYLIGFMFLGLGLLAIRMPMVWNGTLAIVAAVVLEFVANRLADIFDRHQNINTVGV